MSNIDSAKGRLRRKLTKLVDEIDQVVVNAQHIGDRRPELAPQLAPDAFADVLRKRRWALEAIEAIDAGAPLPPPIADGEQESPHADA